ncbi:putative transcription factor GRF family [Medicago truncatula]|uniref:Putative transcription factor GRF family n=1 Tax=Medicago truncatula TaxID=3880 RepID=A0A396I567_MEDTR|nr:putative transcription factor GRF family [Medicago truncatula]
MAGSKASSIGNSKGRTTPKCGCKRCMRLWVSNTDENPQRKFWRCCNFWENEDHCDLFIWDDELETPRVKAMLKRLAAKNTDHELGSTLHNSNGSTGYDVGSSNMVMNLTGNNVEDGCKNCARISEYLRVFGKEIGEEVVKELGKELGKVYGTERASTKHLRTKNKLQHERSKSFGLLVLVVLSWIFFFLVVFKFM